MEQRKTLRELTLLDRFLFNEAINPVFVIIIMPFNLFKKEKYRYTFSMKCEEVPGVDLDDGAVRIFLNTHGKDDEGVSPELKFGLTQSHWL